MRSRALLLPLLLAFACEGPAGPAGTDGEQGPQGDPGPAAPTADAGSSGGSARFAGAGLKLEILEADVAHVKYKITDAAGTPLDVAGKLTEGAVTVRFILAWLDVDALGRPTTYTAYTVRTQTSTISGQSATQATTDGTGVTTLVADGVYNYAFATKVTSPMAGKTHRVAATATRVFDGVNAVANAEYDFVPGNNSATPQKRDIVTDQACNACHDRLEAHGGSRRDVALCITCHSPQTVDPDSGNSVDMTTMIHKIHRGAELPSVEAGTPYQIIGFNNTVADFSTVEFPQDIRKCTTCHTGSQGAMFAERPTRVACASCHDRITFEEPVAAGFTLHSGGAQSTDAACSNCHPSEGGIAGIRDAHMLPADLPTSPALKFEILSVANTAPGQIPEMTIKISNHDAGRDLVAQPMSTLRATVAGPNSDYAKYWQATIQGTGATGTLAAVDAPNGVFKYTFPAAAAMPADATGSYTFALEGNLQVGTSRFSAVGPAFAAAVTDATPQPRRVVVEDAACNRCHNDVQGHGGSRKGVKACVLCHNPENANDDRIARLEGTTVVAQPVDMKVMIHKIHRGEGLENEYILGGNPAPTVANPAGAPVDLGEVRYPGRVQACTTCHKAGTYTLPLAKTIRPSLVQLLACTEDPAADADGYCQTRTTTNQYILPETAVCTSCHDGDSTAAHAAVMTSTMGGESCATCHSPGSAFDPATVHTLDPR